MLHSRQLLPVGHEYVCRVLAQHDRVRQCVLWLDRMLGIRVSHLREFHHGSIDHCAFQRCSLTTLDRAGCIRRHHVRHLLDVLLRELARLPREVRVLSLGVDSNDYACPVGIVVVCSFGEDARARCCLGRDQRVCFGHMLDQADRPYQVLRPVVGCSPHGALDQTVPRDRLERVYALDAMRRQLGPRGHSLWRLRRRR